MASLIERVEDFFRSLNPKKTLWIGFSGGLDSTVLLHLCKQFSFPVKAIHVHHHLNPRADEWVLHCEKLCNEWNIELITKKINAKNAVGESPEEIARDKRYEVFAEIINEDEILLTAHHQDDQAETVLLQLFRGAGPKGLAAMPFLKSFAKGFHGRPLLNCSRAEIHAYAKAHQLVWIEDDSNENQKFSRNFIRHEVMPLLQSRWPTVQSMLARTAKHCANQQALLDIFIEKDLQNIISTPSVMPAKAGIQQGNNNPLSVSKLLQLDCMRQQAVLRAWITKNHFTLPSTIKLQHIIKNILHAQSDKCPVISFGECEVRRYQNNLYIMQKRKFSSQQVIEWNLNETLEFNDSKWIAVPTQGEGLCSSITNVTVRFRQGGEKIQLPGRKHHHDLKKLLQTWQVKPWLRDEIPLIFINDVLAAVGDLAVAEPFLAKLDQPGWKMVELTEYYT